MSEVSKWKLECGCWIDSFRYHKICAKHETEFNEVHTRWTADKVRLDKEKEERELLRRQ